MSWTWLKSHRGFDMIEALVFWYLDERTLPQRLVVGGIVVFLHLRRTDNDKRLFDSIRTGM